MPGNIGTSTDLVVMPLSLCKAFTHSRKFEISKSEYPEGDNQRNLLVTTSRRSWSLSKRLTPSALQELREFYESCFGPTFSFYFYDPYMSGFTYDATGVQTAGRYIVRFNSGWQQSSGLARCDTSITLIECA